MFPSKESLEQYLKEKMTNEDIAKIYGLSFQKVIGLIKKYQLDPNELRQTDQYIVYLHREDGEVVYVGSGVWYRMRRYTNRRNVDHRKMMQSGDLEYEIVAEYSERRDALIHEQRLIHYYKNKNLARFNKYIA
ncbi:MULTISPECIES: hypothetical protein [unclassified Exiguobacterium]|uniref:hypothetical protein n=1 Tax=unclassified Exiguobacterium TaxID=2644629 RepID=UPI001BE57CD2